MSLFLRTVPDPVLRQVSAPVRRFDRALSDLTVEMQRMMLAHKGIGLAAPQVGISQRIAIVEVPKSDDIVGSGVLYTLINPEVIKQSEETWEHQEGCLSIPGWRGDVARPYRIVVRALDREGNRIKYEVEGHVARAFLHEIDHLDGVLYIDKLVSPDRVWRVKEEATEDLE